MGYAVGEGMRKPALIGAIAATLLVGTAGAQAGPWEYGMVAGLRDVSKTMTLAEMAQAREMAQACEAANYRSCEY